MIKIKEVEMLDSKKAIKQIIYVPINIECTSEENDRIIMEKVVYNNFNRELIKFNPEGVVGAENVKNPQHLWCDAAHLIWQVCSGHVKDMNNNDIPNCWYVRAVGVWR